MCTVTFLPLQNDDFILTSNRDESAGRETEFPKIYEQENVKMLYPRDKKAGGTWIGISGKKRIACLINGGYKNHKSLENYKFSRGIVVKEFLKSEDLLEFTKSFDISNIEPFTLIIVDWNALLKLYELVWDGKTKHFQILDKTPKIWSSSTLYNDKIKKKRKKWFSDWCDKNKKFSKKAILKFHQNTKKGSPENAIQMKRTNIKTVSVTSVSKTNKILSMFYKNLLDQTEKETTFSYM